MWPHDWVVVTSGFLEEDPKKWYLLGQPHSRIGEISNYAFGNISFQGMSPQGGGLDGRFYLMSFGKSISKYKWIMSLVLDVDDYDKLHGFLDGLQPTVNERGSGEMGIVNLGGSDRDHRVSG